MPLPPAVGVTNQAMIVLGGKTFEILYFGAAHTDKDLVILIPEDRVLVMGDLLCFRKCRILESISDPENWIFLLDALINRQHEYDSVIPGHWGAVLVVDALVEQRDYLRSIVETVRRGRFEGLSLGRIIDTSNSSRYKDYSMSESLHEDIQTCWHLLKPSEITEELHVSKNRIYFGQAPPGSEPEVFAPGIVSTEHVEFGITFSPEADEMYFTRRVSREEGNRILESY